CLFLASPSRRFSDLFLLLFSIFAVDGFLTSQNIQTLLRNASFLGFVALGMTFVVVAKQIIDLSIVAQIAVSAVIVVSLSEHGFITAIVAAIVVNLVFSFI